MFLLNCSLFCVSLPRLREWLCYSHTDQEHSATNELVEKLIDTMLSKLHTVFKYLPGILDIGIFYCLTSSKSYPYGDPNNQFDPKVPLVCDNILQ